MCLLVAGEVPDEPKGFAAQLALVGPFPGVDSSVRHQRGLVPEGLPTLSTLVWLLSHVDSAMLD